jgi:hypothetical protein
MNRLFVFGGFAHDSQRILAAVRKLTFVHVKLSPYFSNGACELSIASLADGHHGRVQFNETKLAPQHDSSLAQLALTAECL